MRRGLETILAESERAARIVRNLLTFARKRQTTRAMVDVNQVVRETLALRAYEQRVTNITVIDALAAGLPQVFADGHQVQQVLLNLVINAEQAMLSANGRGTLVVRTWHDADQESVVLEINDDGPGIPDELQPKIFDPFFTTKEVGKGTGLGLTVAYAIVQEHGGRIRARVAAGRRRVVLRRAAGHAAASCRRRRRRARDRAADRGDRRARRSSSSKTRRRSRAAVVDALRDAGYIVDHARGRRGGAGQGRRRRRSISVICDLKMPRLDGMAFYRTLSAARAGTGEARDLRHRRRRRHRRGAVPRGERLPLAREAVPARRSAASGARDARVDAGDVQSRE